MDGCVTITGNKDFKINENLEKKNLESIVNFISDVVDTIYDRKFVLAVFIDLKKGFDTVEQNI